MSILSILIVVSDMSHSESVLDFFSIVFASIIIIIYALGVMPYKYSFHGCPRKSQSLGKVCDSNFVCVTMAYFGFTLYVHTYIK